CYSALRGWPGAPMSPVPNRFSHASVASCAAAAARYSDGMQSEGTYDLTTGAGLIACPRCDALHIERELEPGETARCIRCNTVLASPRAGAFTRIIALSFTSLVLMVGAVFFPF